MMGLARSTRRYQSRKAEQNATLHVKGLGDGDGADAVWLWKAVGDAGGCPHAVSRK